MRTPWREGTVTYGRPRIMGIVNVTPDSFSDGGLHEHDAFEHALRLVDEGADFLDIGGESTRPGFSPVPAEEEIRRILPLVRNLAGSAGVPISVDTMKTEVAAAAIDAGADIVNDVYGLRAEGMAELIASSGVSAVIMHMHGEPGTLHSRNMGGDAMSQILGFLKERERSALDAGIAPERMIIDPGVGFGKTPAQNVEIVDSAGTFSLGHPVLIGVSRKRFLKTQFPGMDADEATVASSMKAVRAGADIIRVHNVDLMRRALEQYADKGADGQNAH